MTRLSDLLEATWPEVRAKHLYPEMPPPRLATSGQDAALNLFGKNISIAQRTICSMAGRLSARETIEALLDHAVAHHVYCPWSLSVHLKLYAEAKRILSDPACARRAADAFMDTVADTYCVSRVNSPLAKLYRHPPQTTLGTIRRALYQELWQIDLGITTHRETARRLARIAYLEPSRWTAGMRRFATLLQPHLQPPTDKSSHAETLSLTGGHGLDQYSRQEIEHGLREFAARVESPEQFSRIVSDFSLEIDRVMAAAGSGIGRGIGAAGIADTLFYMKRAEAFRLPLRTLPLKNSGALYPHHHVAWEASSPFQDIDPWTSFGKTLPGITKTWHRDQCMVFDREHATPEGLILIDSSSSMPDPRRRLSHAVLGAGCACDAYLRSGAKVAVYNFSDAAKGGRHLVFYTRDRTAIYRALCHYLGGGTHIDINGIEQLQTEPPPDIFLITDMQIANLDLVTDYLNRCPNRVTAVHIGSSIHAARFRRRVDLRSKVAIFAVTSAADIPHIILGRVREHLRPPPADHATGDPRAFL